MKLFRELMEEATDGSLLGGDVTTSSEATEASWYYQTPGEDGTGGVAGNGDIPDWYNSKFKSVEEQAKGYGELEKKFGGFSGAPDEYSFDEGMEVDTQDPMLQGFMEIAKEANMNNETFNKVLNNYYSHMEQMQQSQHQAEIEALGPNAQQRLQDINNWINTNADKEMVEKIMNAVVTADGVEAMEYMISKTKSSKLANADAPKPVAMSQSEYAEQLLAKDSYGNLKISSDPSYRKRMDELAKQFA